MKHSCSSAIDPDLKRDLLTVGCPLPSEDMVEAAPDITIEVSRAEITLAYDQRAGTEYVFGVQITNHSYVPLELQEFRARAPWRGLVIFLGDPRVCDRGTKQYRLHSGRKFLYEDVLNWKIREQGKIVPGESLEGILLAYTLFDRIPKNYIHTDVAFFDIGVVDQYKRKHYSEIEVRVDRSATMRPRITRPRPCGLYGDPKSAAKHSDMSENSPAMRERLAAQVRHS